MDSRAFLKAVNAERYMSTFRGCASLARTHALREANFYDERLFIYGNERDLTCRLLNLGYRVLQARKENLAAGIPVDPVIWQQLQSP